MMNKYFVISILLVFVTNNALAKDKEDNTKKDKYDIDVIETVIEKKHIYDGYDEFFNDRHVYYPFLDEDKDKPKEEIINKAEKSDEVKKMEEEAKKHEEKQLAKVEKLRKLNYKSQNYSNLIFKDHYNKENSHLPKPEYYINYEKYAFSSIIKEDINALNANLGKKNLKDINEIMDQKGNSLLHIAAMKNKNVMVRLLLAKNIDPNLKNNNNLTPLHAASFSGNFESVRSLLTMGAENSTVDNSGHIPSDYAENSGHHYLADYIKSNY